MNSIKLKCPKLKNQLRMMTFSELKIIQKQVLEKRKKEIEKEQETLSYLYHRIYDSDESSEPTSESL